MHVFLHVSSFVPLVLFLYCSRDVHNIRKLITKKNHNLWHCSALQDYFFSVQVVVFQCKIRHLLIMIGLALAVSDRLDDTLYHDSLINLALCVIFIEAKFN